VYSEARVYRLGQKVVSLRRHNGRRRRITTTPRSGWIDTPEMKALAARLARNSYGEYLAQLAADGSASD